MKSSPVFQFLLFPKLANINSSTAFSYGVPILVYVFALVQSVGPWNAQAPAQSLYFFALGTLIFWLPRMSASAFLTRDASALCLPDGAQRSLVRKLIGWAALTTIPATVWLIAHGIAPTLAIVVMVSALCFGACLIIPLLSGLLSILSALSAPWGDGGQSTRQTLALLPGLPEQRAGYLALIASRLRPLYCRYLPGAALAIAIAGVANTVAPTLALESLAIVIIWVLAETAIVLDIFSRPDGPVMNTMHKGVLVASVLCLVTTQATSIPAVALPLGVYFPAGAVIAWLAWLALLAVVAARSWQRAKCLPNPYLAASDSRQPVASLTRRILTTRRQSA